MFIFNCLAHHLHGVGEVALDFVEHVLAAAAEENGAGLRVRALGQERKVLVPQLLHLSSRCLRKRKNIQLKPSDMLIIRNAKI